MLEKKWLGFINSFTVETVYYVREGTAAGVWGQPRSQTAV